MAKLKGPFEFEGKLGGLSAYKMEGVEKTILRRPAGPSSKDIKTKATYDITRRNNSEFGGCSTAGKYTRLCFHPLKPVSNFNATSSVVSLMQCIKPLDSLSELGKRNVLISRAAYLLEGFNFNRRNPFETMVRNPLQATIERSTLTASVQFPALIPHVNFFPPGAHSYFRLVAVLAVLPDIFYKEQGYAPEGEFTLYPERTESEWLIVQTGSEAKQLDLQLPAAPSFNSYSLVLSVGIEMGGAGKSGTIETIQRTGCGKILLTA